VFIAARALKVLIAARALKVLIAARALTTVARNANPASCSQSAPEVLTSLAGRCLRARFVSAKRMLSLWNANAGSFVDERPQPRIRSWAKG
jgi:hypothetical protein